MTVTEEATGRTKIELTLPLANRQEAEEFAEFFENMTAAEQDAFMNFVCGANFTRRLLDGSARRAG